MVQDKEMVVAAFTNDQFAGAAANYTNDTVRLLLGTLVEFRCTSASMEFGDTMATSWVRTCNSSRGEMVPDYTAEVLCATPASCGRPKTPPKGQLIGLHSS